MPELPEIESLRQKLEPQLIGATIGKVTLRRKDLRFPIPKALVRDLSGATILRLWRRSKYLLLDTDFAKTWIVHLGMSGRFFFANPDLPIDKHDHVLVNCQDDRQLRFRDPRRFGMMDWLDTKDLLSQKWFAHLGPEPLEDEFSADYLYKVCQTRRTPIKSLLMNAEVVVGVGNIYANESLFFARLHPLTLSCDLSFADIQRLCAQIKNILNHSIQVGGSSIRDYVDANSQPGLYQLSFSVYGRDGQPCFECRTPIESMQLAGRSSFYCTKCQILRNAV